MSAALHIVCPDRKSINRLPAAIQCPVTAVRSPRGHSGGFWR